ncbi:MAG TPA: glycoside hydrolase family 36 protein, partial [Sphingomicrobium sp.]|nr:glycoside hydrolase family 36 protein [Sphingomicrobium sp.]
MAIDVDVAAPSFTSRGIRLGNIQPLINGEVATDAPPEVDGNAVRWQLGEGVAILEIETSQIVRFQLRVEGLPEERPIDSLGLRFGRIDGIRAYLRNGYQSWDGSFFVEPGTPAGDGPPAKAPTLGFAMTALLPRDGPGAFVLGFSRHDRFQSRFRFGGTAAAPTVDVETLWDFVPHAGTVEAEPLVIFEDDQVEEALRRWSRITAAESPLPPRIPERRITGWCSWYNLYAAIDERSILEHLRAAAKFRDQRNTRLDVFQIDDGFAPEMGDWLDLRPQFPRGMKPLIEDIAAAGFTPGLWIAPFLVGNRSRLFAGHPDWVVQSTSGGPLAHMKFYGEFRWHKRSEEYYVLDVTHPDAAAYIRQVFRTWQRDWGARYFKTDFMNAGMEYGPDEARWHRPGLSRVEIWRTMAAIIREEIGDALWLGCGCPLWASVGLIDAARIGRDIGVSWRGDYSAESLLRDQLTRNHASGILWQADPDCVLLRGRFHELSDEEVRSLLLFAGFSGGVLMTSDKLDEIPGERGDLFARLLSQQHIRCGYPELGNANGGLIIQRVTRADDT